MAQLAAAVAAAATPSQSLLSSVNSTSLGSNLVSPSLGSIPKGMPFSVSSLCDPIKVNHDQINDRKGEDQGEDDDDQEEKKMKICVKGRRCNNW